VINNLKESLQLGEIGRDALKAEINSLKVANTSLEEKGTLGKKNDFFLLHFVLFFRNVEPWCEDQSDGKRD
jgi:hypothetical protein